MLRAASPPRSLPTGSPRASFGASFRVRPPSTVSDLSQQVEPSQAYVLEWSRSGYQRSWIAGSDELRAAVEARTGTGLGLGTAFGSTPSAGTSAGNDPADVFRLLVIHGLPADLVRTLRASIDIDPAFLEAHAGRRRYRPGRWRRDARWAHYEYPELVRGHGDARPPSSSCSFAFTTAVAAPTATVSPAASPSLFAPFQPTVVAATVIDLLPEPTAHTISLADDEAVLFCRASLWMAPQADVLFIDRPVWRDPAFTFRKARRKVSVTKPFQIRSPFRGFGPGTSNNPMSNSPGLGVGLGLADVSGTNPSPAWDVQLAPGDEILSLEDELLGSLKDAVSVGDAVFDLVAELAYDHWLDFFETLGPHPRPGDRHATSLLWQIAQSLEQNLDLSERLARIGHSVSLAKHRNWQVLVDRAQLRVDISHLIAPKISLVSNPADASSPFSVPPSPPVHPRSRSPSRSRSKVKGGNGHSMDEVEIGLATTATPDYVPPPPPQDYPLQDLPRTRTIKSNEIMLVGPGGASLGMGPGLGQNAAVPDPIKEANQRSLDRISYMGGILFPITLVSSILSIPPPWGPGSLNFWVFWVVSVVVAVIGILIVYIDQLRWLETWVETSAVVVPSLLEAGKLIRISPHSLPYTISASHKQEISGDDVKVEPVYPMTTITETITTTMAAAPVAVAMEHIVVDMSSAVEESLPPELRPRRSKHSLNSLNSQHSQHSQGRQDQQNQQNQPNQQDDVELLCDSSVYPRLLVQQRSDGSKQKAWERKPLGVAGAIKKVLGVYRLRGDKATVQFLPPPVLDSARMKTGQL